MPVRYHPRGLIVVQLYRTTLCISLDINSVSKLHAQQASMISIDTHTSCTYLLPLIEPSTNVFLFVVLDGFPGWSCEHPAKVLAGWDTHHRWAVCDGDNYNDIVREAGARDVGCLREYDAAFRYQQL